MPSPFHIKNPWYQYLNKSVMLIVIAIGSITLALSLPLSPSIPAASTSVANFITFLLLCNALAFSAFIIIGLNGIKAQSKKLHADIAQSDTEDALTEAETEFGSTHRALCLTKTALSIAWVAGVTNGSATAITAWGKNESANAAWQPWPWLMVSVIAGNFSNLVGFAFITLLSARNAQLAERHQLLFKSQHIKALQKKEDEIKKLGSALASQRLLHPGSETEIPAPLATTELAHNPLANPNETPLEAAGVFPSEKPPSPT